MRFVRYVVPTWNHHESQVSIGVIGAAYELHRRSNLDETLRAELARSLRWFEEHLPIPDRFNRTTSKGWYRRETRGVSWFRASAREHLAEIARLVDSIARCGYATTVLRTERAGYIVYEDDFQVVAEPFRDTPTK